MGSGCKKNKVSGNCAKLISSNCVLYEGPPIPILNICTGDTITETQQAIIDKLVEISNGDGIDLQQINLKNCKFLFDKFAASQKTIQTLFQLLIDSNCLLKSEIDELKNIIAGSGNNTTFDLKCVTPPVGTIDSDKILQAVINAVCLVSEKINDVIKNAGNTTVISSTINQALSGLISSPGANGIKKSTSSSGQVSYSIVALPPPGTLLLYTGSLSHFDNSGKGLAGTALEGWFLCNGNNGTIDMRGFVPVGFIQGAGGPTLDAIVDPVGNQDVTMNYTMGQTGGKARVTLDNSQIPNHSHPVNDPGHSHNYDYPNKDKFSGSKFDAAKSDGFYTKNTTRAFTGITIAGTGGGGSHENRMPFRACAFITRFD